MVALLIYSIYRAAAKPEIDDEPIVISVPVNLRELTSSRTLRNCFCIVNISIPILEGLTLEGILHEVQRQLSEKTKQENLEAAVAESCGIFQNPVVKNVPRFVREAGTKFAFAYFAENLKTMTLSNVGEVVFPQDMQPWIQRVEAVIYPTERSPINCCMCSTGGTMTISFIRSIQEADVVREFFRRLSREVDCRIEIESNNWGNAE